VVRTRASPDGGLLNEVNENLLLFRHLNLDNLDIAITRVDFLFHSNDSFSRIPCVVDLDYYAMRMSKNGVRWIALEFVALNENIAVK